MHHRMSSEFRPPDIYIGPYVKGDMMGATEFEGIGTPDIQVCAGLVVIGLPGHQEIGSHLKPGFKAARFIGGFQETARHKSMGAQGKVDITLDEHVFTQFPVETYAGYFGIVVGRVKVGVITANGSHKVAFVFAVKPGKKCKPTAELTIL